MTLRFRVLIETILLSTHNIFFNLEIIAITHYYSYRGEVGYSSLGYKVPYASNKHILYTLCNYLKNEGHCYSRPAGFILIN